MKAATLAAATLFAALSATAASAQAPSRFQPWLDGAAAELSQTVSAADPTAPAAVVSVEVEPNKRLSAPRLVRSTGDADTDKAILDAVRETKLSRTAPHELVNRRVVLSVTPSAALAAAAIPTRAAR